MRSIISLALTALKAHAHRSTRGRFGMKQDKQFAHPNEEKFKRVFQFHLNLILTLASPRQKPT
jgi:hypothetical protein